MNKKSLKIFSFIMMIAIFISSTQVTLSCIASDLQMNESVMDQTLVETTDPVNIADTSEYEEEAYIVGEDEALRKENEKHFRLSDGTYIAVAYAEPVHYMDDGEWKDIDNTLTLTEEGYVNAANDFTVTFGTESSSSELYTLTDGEYTVKMYLKDQSSDGTATYALRPSMDRKVSLKEVTLETVDSFDVMSSTDSVEQFKEKNPNASEEQIREIVKEQNEENKRQREFMMKPKNVNSSLEFTDIIGNVDIEYVVTSTSVKENIILESADDGNVFEFVLDTELDAVLNDDGTIDLKDGDGIIFSMPAPYMYDANGIESTEVEYSLATVDGKTVLTVTADDEWINDSERVFPVTIDPTVSSGKTDGEEWRIITQYISDSDLVTAHQGDAEWKFGYDPDLGKIYSYLYVQHIPELPFNCTYTGAAIYMGMYYNGYTSVGASEFDISVREAVAGDWANQFNSVGTVNSNPIIDYVTVSDTTEETYISFDITNVANSWRSDETANTGLVFTSSLPNGSNMSSTNYATAVFRGYINTTTETSGMPFFVMSYRNYVGVEDYYTYHTASAGRAGSAYISDRTGYLTFTRSLTSAAGVGLSYIYNSPYGDKTFTASVVYNTVDYSNMKSANGWRLNYQQSVVEKTLKEYNGTELANITYLVFSDSDGTEHYFRKNEGESVYKDEDGLGLEISGSFSKYTMTDDKDNQKIFIYGYLSEIIDRNGNKTVLLYDTTSYSESSSDWKPKSSASGGKNQLRKIIYIPDGQDEITIATLQYNTTTKILEAIVDRTDKEITLNVSSEGFLTSIEDFDETLTRYRYSPSPFCLMAAYDAESEYGLQFTYNADRPIKVESYSDFTVEDESFYAESAKDIKNLIWRSEAGQTARFRHTGGDQASGTDDDILTTYAFDVRGRTITTRAEDNEGNTIGVAAGTYTQNSGTAKTNNKLLKEGGTGAIGHDLLMESGFENDIWETSSPNVTNYSVTRSSQQAHTGNSSAKLTASEDGNWVSMSQYRSVSEAGTYTFSAYIKVTDMDNIGSDGGGVRVAIKASDGITNLATSRYITQETANEVDNGWVKLFCTVEIEEPRGLYITVTLNRATGTVYVDDAQFEKNSSASPYNLLENGSFASFTRWASSSNAEIDDNETQPDNESGSVLRLNGAIYRQAYAAQTVNVNLPASETYIIGGWAKSETVPTPNEDERTFQITATINYSDGKTEAHTNHYSYYVWNEWQYVSAPVVPEEPDKTVSSITVTCSYKYNANTAYFDDVFLIREAAQSYTYDDDGNVIAVNKTNTDELEGVYDGGDLISTTGGAGGLYTYTYDDNHNVTKASNNGVDMNLEYDAVGNVESTKIEGSGGSFMYTEAEYTDSKTKVSKVTDSLGNETTNTYFDDTDLLKSTTYEVSSSNTSNRDTDMTEYTYDDSDRLHMAYETGEIALIYGYSMGNVTSIQRKGFIPNTTGDVYQTYSFTYNDYGQTLTTKVGDRTLATNTYDSKTHNLKMLRYGTGELVLYTYDNLDRIKTVRYNSIGKKVTYSYDYMGNVAVEKVTNVAGDIEYATYYYEYDSLGRPVRFFETLGDEIVQQVQYTYDSKNRTTSVSYYDGAEMRTALAVYDDDDGGKLLRYDFGGSEGAIGYGYDDLNRNNYKYYRRDVGATSHDWKVFYTFKNGTETNQTTSLVSQLKYQLSPNDSSKNYTLNYIYDNLGNITKVTRSENNGTTKNVAKYVYDENGQLVVESVYDDTQPYSVVYTYDTYGNIRKADKYRYCGYTSPYHAETTGTLISTETYGYTDSTWADLLTSYNGHTITYDALGNPLSYYNGQDYTFTWENGNQLASTVTGGKTVTYEYNADGIRTEKHVSGTADYYYRLDGSKVVEMSESGIYGDSRYVFVYDEAGNPHEMHYYAGGSTTPSKYYYVLNAQGDVVQIRDESNAVVANYTYDAWGKVLSVTGANGNEITNANTIANLNPIRYRGYFYDNETKLYYCNSRYYDPQIRRFINADDLAVLNATPGEFTDKNLFAYCDNNPVMRGDNGGEFWHSIIGAAVGAVAGVVGQAISDVVTSAINGKVTISNWQTYAGAAIGGAAGGLVLANTGSVSAANAVTGAVTTGVGQSLEKLTIKGYDKSWAEIGANTVVDGSISYGLGKLPGVKGITAGKNSWSAVYKSGLTKLRNGTASRMSAKVIGKGIGSSIVGGLALDGYYGIKQHAYDRVKRLLK